MKKERWRKIKLIPVKRNAELYYGFPQYQGILFFMSGLSYTASCAGAPVMVGMYHGPDGTGEFSMVSLIRFFVMVAPRAAS